MTKTTTKATATAKESAPAAALIVLGYDENHKPRAARFPATEAELVTKAAQLMDLRVYEAASEDLAALAKKLPEGRLYGVAASCLMSGKACTARSSWRSRSNHRPRSAKSRTSYRSRPASADLGRDRAWPSRHRSGRLGLRLVGSRRPRSHRRHVHAAVSGLPEAAQVCAASCGSRVDEPSGLE